MIIMWCSIKTTKWLDIDIKFHIIWIFKKEGHNKLTLFQATPFTIL